jgi:hypothetical protein
MAGTYYRCNELSDSVKYRKILELALVVVASQVQLSSKYLITFLLEYLY